MPKQQNLLLVTEHYPCGFQEAFLESEIEYLTRLYNVHVITTDTDRLMTRALPRGVTFSRPAEHTRGLRRIVARVQSMFSRGFFEECQWARKQGRLNAEFRKNTLDALTESRRLYNYVRTLDIFQDERPLTIYSANMNASLYGLCCLKVYSDDIKVVARCHRANMADPVTGERRDTLNHIVNDAVDALYFTSEDRRMTYAKEFCRGETSEMLQKLRMAPLGVPGPLKKQPPASDEFLLRLVTCSPIEKDKRLDLLIEGIAGVEHGCIEWVHIGDGTDRERILSLAREKLGSKPGIRYRFVGRMSQRERYRWYAETPADVLFSVSRSESVPASMLEAMANHVFVCATAVDGVTDVLDSDCAMLMPADPTAEQLSRLLELLCGINREPFYEKSEKAFARWEKTFNADKNCIAFVRELAGMPPVEEPEAEEPEEKEALEEQPGSDAMPDDVPAGEAAAEEKSAEEPAENGEEPAEA
ncbi:MAG: glycosyltransferase [Oscillospiraceae bacterium]|nr:glycosyltransferase [Oscillospiraceae bacterium]